MGRKFLVAIGLLLLSSTLGAGDALAQTKSPARKAAASADASTKLFSLAGPVPKFPDLGPPDTFRKSGVKLYHVDLGKLPENGNGPGCRMRMRVYVPAGELAKRSRGCILVAPAGTIMITGSDLEDDKYHVETLPYAIAGYVVVNYSLDGPHVDDPTNQKLPQAYKKFVAAKGGMINARNAFLFASELDAVDPARIYAAGHSSAANIALLFAEHEPRLAGCIAYAPDADLVHRLAELIATPKIELVLPKLKAFAAQAAPLSHLGDLKCPVFLFHARDDSNVKFDYTVELGEKLLAAGNRRVKMQLVEHGDHYDSMVKEGIPAGIAWLREIDGELAAKSPATREKGAATEPAQSPPAEKRSKRTGE